MWPQGASSFPCRFGKYILLDRINSGGMAEVFRAKMTGAEDFSKLLAIKCMLPSVADDAVVTEMFIDEAKLAAQLNHAGIVQIYELGRLNERLYIAMELVKGRDVRHILSTAHKRGVAVPVPLAAYVISKAAEALDHAHRMTGTDGHPLNLVHRDVSPQNILLSYSGEVKVVDFGIAKAEVRATRTQAGALKGKVPYMAPEQLTDIALDRRVDIFALGAVLYELITGQRLFSGTNELAVLESIRNGSLPNFREHIPRCPPALDAALKRALRRERDERFSYASDMAEALESLLIDTNSIYGTKRAGDFMQMLYADEIAAMEDRLRAYAAITEESLNETYQPIEMGKEACEVIESSPALASLESFTEPEFDASKVQDASNQDASNRIDTVGRGPAWVAPDRVAPSPFDVPTEQMVVSAPVSKATEEYSVLGSSHRGKSRIVRVAAVVLAALLSSTIVAWTVSTGISIYRRGQTIDAVETVLPVETVPPYHPESHPAPTRSQPKGHTRTNEKPALGATLKHEGTPSSVTTPRANAEGPDRSSASQKARAPRRRFRRSAAQAQKAAHGFVIVSVRGTGRFRIYIDDKPVGYAPAVLPAVTEGHHEVTAVEETSDNTGRKIQRKISVSVEHTRGSPLRVDLE